MEIKVTDNQNQKPKITYPCQWGFKVIGTEEDAVRAAVKACLADCLNDKSGDREYELGFSRVSGEGKYVSLTLNMEVQDEEERNNLFRALADRAEIRMVI